MSSPPEPSPTLDDLELRARELVAASADEVTWTSLHRELDSDLFRGAPSPDPDAARRSGKELDLLALVLGPHPHPAPAVPRKRVDSRAGYVIEGERGSKDAVVQPAFAEALATPAPSRDLVREFSDLWAVDLGLWHQLCVGAPSSELGRRWLTSPGRRLLQEVTVLHTPPGQDPPGAADFSPERLKDAAGTLGPRVPADAAWHELHAALPGIALSRWQPAEDDVSGVLRILEGRRGEPVFMRGAALAWLLDRAATSPHYETMGLQRDLREDLLLAFLEGFPPPEDALRHAQLRAAARLEHACLLQAARRVPAEGPDSTRAAWSVARWLQSCTFRSPFLGGDEESLAARLRALLPAEALETQGLRDLLHPGRFGEDEEGLDVVDLALLAGAVHHYWPEATHPQLLPTPLPLVQALRRIAHRPLKAGESHSETLLEQFRTATGDATAPRKHPAPPEPTVENALEWSAHHIAPPLVARWLMTHHRISWWEQAPATVQRECIERFRHEPSRYDWVAFALYLEGGTTHETVRSEAVDAWRSTDKATEGRLGSQGVLSLMGAGLLQHLSDMDALRLPALAHEARPDWRHRDLEAIAEAAEKLGRTAVWRAALDGLLKMCTDAAVAEQERVKAALLALRRTSSFNGPEREGYLQRLSLLAAQAPFQQNVSLRRELRRLGFSPGQESKGTR